MAGRRGINPVAGDDCVQEEAEEITALSPKTPTIHLLAVEESLGDLHSKFDRLMENVGMLNWRMEEPPAPRQIEANVLNGHNFDGRRG